MGWLLWELMGAAGRGRREVLGTDPEIFREQVLFFFCLWLPCLLFLDLIGGSLSWSPWSLGLGGAHQKTSRRRGSEVWCDLIVLAVGF